MSKLPIALAVTVAVVGGAGLALQQQSISALRREVGILRLQQQADKEELLRAAARTAKLASTEGAADGGAAGAARPAGVATGSSPADAAEVAKLREEVNSLKKTAQEFGKLVQASQAKSADAQVPTKLTPAAQLKNNGWTTPVGAAETVIWSAVAGDVDVLAQGIGLTSTAKAKADAWFAQLSDTAKAQYGSPEKVLALMIARDAGSVSGMQVLGQTELAPDQVGVRLRVGSEEGKTKDDTFLFRQTGNGWRLVVPDQVVERYAKQLSAKGNGGK